MPRFRYTATNAQGKTVRGVTDAPSEEALYTKLRDDGLYMTDAQEAQKSHSAFRPLKTAMLADFCRNLGTLLAAGVLYPLNFVLHPIDSVILMTLFVAWLLSGTARLNSIDPKPASQSEPQKEPAE